MEKNSLKEENKTMINAKLQRILLLIILVYEGWGGITGGTLLTFAPDGHIMKMSTDILHGYFPNFLIPGIILTALGFLTTAGFFAVLFKAKAAQLLSVLSMGGYIIWFLVEIILVGTHWLQAMWGIPVVVGFMLTLSMIPWFEKRRIPILSSMH